MISYSELEKDIADLSQQVAHASNAAKSGQVFSVTDMPKVTDYLCQEISKLDAKERARLSPKLLALIEELDNLTITIQSSLDLVKIEMKETTSHNKAARAYTSANTTGKK
ncbi:hypothetical protein O4H49_06810 [Kiloniella laminariae]|uniref:Flagellar protein FliT n=1 Tax=Kiloniella laminariae TaxID=454162 RepID=A0ABT4LH98_9PROT|nr:hypothetical protein [Kiloniella laminariae]MCZ4280480.1 hypothetical protein [Kiloniella laminariae]